MTSDQLKAAAERLRELFAATEIDWENAPLAAWVDLEKVARAYLAEHDPTPVAERNPFDYMEETEPLLFAAKHCKAFCDEGTRLNHKLTGLGESIDTLASHYLAEHDPTPVTKDWLISIGFHEGEHFIFGINNGDYENAINGHFWSNPPVHFVLRAGDMDVTEYATRGQVRSLCRVLGIVINERN